MRHGKRQQTGQRKIHWERFSKERQIDNYEKAVFLQEAEAICEMLPVSDKAKIADLGTGFADVSILLAKKLDDKKVIYALDSSPSALKRAARNVQNARLLNKIVVKKEDAYSLSFKDNYFDGGFSTGYECCGAYPGATEEFCRVVKKDSIIVMDFVNALNLYHFLTPQRAWNSVIKLMMYYGLVRSNKRPFHIGVLGIGQHFKKYGLQIEEVRFLSTSPPILRNRLGVRSFLFIESLLRLLGPFRLALCRVIIVKFRNTQTK